MATDREAGRRARVRRRFLKEGLDHFQPYEVMEMILYSMTARGDTKPVAHALMDYFGSITAVLDAPYEELVKVKGVGENIATALMVLPEFFRYYHCEHCKLGTAITCAEDAGEFLQPFYIGRTNEVVFLICLNSKQEVLSCEMIGEGTVNVSAVSMRKIMESALRVGAAAVILSHNHPQGLALPSRADLIVTKEIKEYLRTINIELVDHIIVDQSDFVSLAQSGKI